MTSVSEKKCLVVLGMHRSGTSALSGALSLAGYSPGKQLFEPEEDNPKGNYENARITLLNENILDALYARWHDTLLIPDDWWDYDLFEASQRQIIEILVDEFIEDTPVLIKDPRMSVLLPLYLKAFKQLQVQPKFVVCIRNPFEISASLGKRNHLSQQKSLLLWMDYQLKAEFYSRGFPRIFISYQDFLARPMEILRAIREKVAPEMLLNPESEENIMAFLDKGLKHHNLSEQLSETESLPELNEYFNLLVRANLNDLSGQEIARADLLMERFYRNAWFYNGLARQFHAMLIAVTETGKRLSFMAPVKYGTNQLDFSLDQAMPVRHLVLKPSNSRVGLKIIDQGFFNDRDEMVSFKEYHTNAAHETKDRMLIFESEMPEITFDFQTPVIINRVRFDIAYVAFGRPTYRMGIHYKSEFTSDLIATIKELESQKQSILAKVQALENKLNLTIGQLNQAVELNQRYAEEVNLLKKNIGALQFSINTMEESLAWKAGRFITAPARFVYDVSRKTSSGDQQAKG